MPPLSPRMRVLVSALIACIVFGAAWGVRACRSAVGDPALSALANRALRESPERLHPVRGERCVVYAADTRIGAIMREEADYAVLEIARRLGVTAPTATVHILLIPGAGPWKALARAQGFRPDSLALNAGHEILLRDDPEQAARPDRLAHELVHVVLRSAYGPDVPLWLDEGLAGQIGFAVGRAYRAARGTRMSGAWPGVSAAGTESLDAMTARTRLPEDPNLTMVFYRASEELVAWIEERLGPARMRAFVAAAATGAPWRAALEEQLNGLPFSTVELENAIRRAVELPRQR